MTTAPTTVPIDVLSIFNTLPAPRVLSIVDRVIGLSKQKFDCDISKRIGLFVADVPTGDESYVDFIRKILKLDDDRFTYAVIIVGDFTTEEWDPLVADFPDYFFCNVTSQDLAA